MREKYSYFSLAMSAATVLIVILAFTTRTVDYIRLFMGIGVVSANVLALLSPKKGGSRSLALTVSILLAIPVLLMEYVGWVWRNGGFGN